MAAAAAMLVPALAGCGQGYSAGVINMYAPGNDAAFIESVGDQCSADSGGRYRIVTTKLPKEADDQRLQLARRLAGDDSTLDLMALDVVWTAEFADAGWIVPVPEPLASQVAASTLSGPLTTAEWKTATDSDRRLYAIPTWTNTQLLWYRPDVLQKYLHRTTPATTWQQMIADAKTIYAQGGPSYIMVQGRQYEGLMVWFNSVLASAGGEIVDPSDASRQTLNDTPAHRAATVAALRTMKAVASAPGRDPSLTNSNEDAARLGMEKGQASYEVNYPFVFASMRSNAAAGSVKFFPEMTKYASLFADDSEPSAAEIARANKTLAQRFAFALYPGVTADIPGKGPVGGINIAVAGTSRQQSLAFTAARCLTSEAAQRVYALQGAQPPVNKALYSDADFAATYPMGDQISTQLDAEHSAPRPATPAYQAISTLITAKLSPVGAWDPETLVDELADAVQKAINGEGLIP